MTNANATTITTAAADSKANKARAIFNDCYKDGVDKAPQRKVILDRFVNEAGCTEKGAATYLQNFKKAAGITAPQLAAKAAAAATATA